MSGWALDTFVLGVLCVFGIACVIDKWRRR